MAFERIDEHLEFDREVHAFKLDGRPVPSITQCLVMSDLIDTQWFTEYGRERGSAVHRACHYLDENDLDPGYLDGEQTGYLDAWDLFFKQHHCQWIEIEKPAYSIPLQIAGIPDRVGLVDREMSVVEIKTGSLYTVTGVQLALQARIVAPTDPLNRYAVQLKPDGTYFLQPYKDRNDFKVAMAALTITHFKRRTHA